MNKTFVIALIALLAFSAYADVNCDGLVAYTTGRDYKTNELTVQDGYAYKYKLANSGCEPLDNKAAWEPLGKCINDVCANIPEWNNSTHYNKGQKVEQNGVIYTATAYSYCQSPEDAGTPWEITGTCYIDCHTAKKYDPAAPKSSFHYEKNDIIKSNYNLYLVKFWTNDDPETNSGPYQAYVLLYSCKVKITVDKGDCASISTQSEFYVCIGDTVTVTATSSSACESRVIGGATRTFIALADTTITFDCECRVYVDISGDCVSTPANGKYKFWPSDKDDLTVTVAPPTKGLGKQCRILSVKVDGVSQMNKNSVALVDIVENKTIVTDCECQFIVDVSGDCVTSISGKKYFYPSDQAKITIDISTPAPGPNEVCRIVSVIVDGVNRGPQVSVVIAPIGADYDHDSTIVTDCICEVVCPKFFGCDATPVWDPMVHYQKCDCAKYTFINYDDTSKNAEIVFCTNAYSYCQSPENYANWEVQAICKPNITCANAPVYSTGKVTYAGGIIKYNGYLYVARWYATENPDSQDPQWGSYKKLNKC